MTTVSLGNKTFSAPSWSYGTTLYVICPWPGTCCAMPGRGWYVKQCDRAAMITSMLTERRIEDWALGHADIKWPTEDRKEPVRNPGRRGGGRTQERKQGESEVLHSGKEGAVGCAQPSRTGAENWQGMLLWRPPVTWPRRSGGKSEDDRREEDGQLFGEVLWQRGRG